MKKLFLLLACALPLAFVSCDDDDDEPVNENKVETTDYSKVLPGHWANDMENWGTPNGPTHLEEFSFDYDGKGTIVTEYMERDNIEVYYVVSGTYTVSGNKINVKYDEVHVHSKGGYGINGFENGKSCNVTYTIESFEGGVLKMRDNLKTRAIFISKFKEL